MAQKPLREWQAKQLIAEHWEGPGKPEIRFAAIDAKTDLGNPPKEYEWLTKGKLVAKVDELFGKRGKLGYVKIAEDLKEATQWIEQHRGAEAKVEERSGVLNHFLIEPFLEHEKEYYLAFLSERHHDTILFSEQGGMEVEEQGDSIIRIPVELDGEPKLNDLPIEIHHTVQGLFALWRKLDLSYLEINPLVEVDGTVYLLDAVARVDTTAGFRQRSTWGSMEIPEGFGSAITPEEKAIQTLDAKTGASLKFVLLNPEGHIWTMVAGGGASIIYADDIVSQVPASELANYGEWSGNPSTDEMEAYTDQILELMTRNNEPKALIIGGGIANFTDIKKTFAGIIHTLERFQDKMKNIRIYVRRAGPNDRKGLAALQKACDAMGITCETHGAEMPMTEVVGKAISELKL